MGLANVVIKDPIYRPAENPGWLERVSRELIQDPRDYPFIRLIVQVACTVMPAALYLFTHPDFRWWVAALYLLAVMGYFFAPVVLMLHNTSHRPLFKLRYQSLRHVIPWGVGPFFGQTPETYFAHHIGMHHVEENLTDDLSSTMHFQRDGLLDFGRYLGDFYLVGLPRLLVYFRQRKRKKLFRRAFVGELSYYAAVALALALNWRAGLVVFVIPLLTARFGMMAGNWAQHAFVDAADPGNPYRSSITCINTAYNRRCFNDGYHIGHHVKATRHWTEMIDDFMDNRERYVSEGAVVFGGIDYFGVWLLLMLKRYDWLVDRFYVNLSDRPLDRGAVIARLRALTERIPRAAEAAELVAGRA